MGEDCGLRPRRVGKWKTEYHRVNITRAPGESLADHWDVNPASGILGNLNGKEKTDTKRILE